MTTRDTDLPLVFTLDDGFADPKTHHPSLAAVFRMADGTRVELAIRDAVNAYVCDGPRIEQHRLLVGAPPLLHRARVVLVQIDDLRKLDGVPEILHALKRFEAGALTDAVRYVSAAGPQWAPLIDLLGGPV